MNEVYLYCGQCLKVATSQRTAQPDTWDVEVWISEKCHLVSANGGYPARLFPSALLAIEFGKTAAIKLVDRIARTRAELIRLPGSMALKTCLENPCNSCEYSIPHQSLVCVSGGNLASTGSLTAVKGSATGLEPATPLEFRVENWIQSAGSTVSSAAARVFVTLVVFILTILFRRAFSRFDDDEFC